MDSFLDLICGTYNRTRRATVWPFPITNNPLRRPLFQLEEVINTKTAVVFQFGRPELKSRLRRPVYGKLGDVARRKHITDNVANDFSAYRVLLLVH